MRNLAKKLAVLALATCGFGLGQHALAGDRVTVIHSHDHRAPYSMRGHGHAPALLHDRAPYGHSHRNAQQHRFCRDYGYRHSDTAGRYDRHGYGYGKTRSDWRTHSHPEPRRDRDHRDRHVTNTAHAKSYRY